MLPRLRGPMARARVLLWAAPGVSLLGCSGNLESGPSPSSGGLSGAAGQAGLGGQSPLTGGATGETAGQAGSGGTSGGPPGAGGAPSGGAPITGGESSGGVAMTGGASSGGGPGGAGLGGSSAGGNASGGAPLSGGSPATGGAPSGGSPGGGTTATGDRSTPESVCARWNADRANLSEGTWSGSFESCDPGEVSPDGIANALRQFNLYRWLANLPPVATDPERNSQAQACSLMQGANWRDRGLSHDPPSDWLCYTEEGAQGSSSSNISGGPGVSSVDAYLVDSGNESTMGHRRIVLSNDLGPIGLGSTPQGSCMQNLRGTGQADNPWTAWPSPGPFPIQALAPGRSTLDDTGWSLQSTDIRLSGAEVQVTTGGMELPVDVSTLTGSYGGNNAIRIQPNGWESQAGQTYAVSVTGIDTPIEYAIELVDCEG